jgi:hypothetical protein
MATWWSNVRGSYRHDVSIHATRERGANRTSTAAATRLLIPRKRPATSLFLSASRLPQVKKHVKQKKHARNRQRSGTTRGLLPVRPSGKIIRSSYFREFIPKLSPLCDIYASLTWDRQHTVARMVDVMWLQLHGGQSRPQRARGSPCRFWQQLLVTHSVSRQAADSAAGDTSAKAASLQAAEANVVLQPKPQPPSAVAAMQTVQRNGAGVEENRNSLSPEIGALSGGSGLGVS